MYRVNHLLDKIFYEINKIFDRIACDGKDTYGRVGNDVCGGKNKAVHFESFLIVR
jgi:hypothetical protein